MSKQQISKQTHHFFLTFCLAVPLFSHMSTSQDSFIAILYPSTRCHVTFPPVTVISPTRTPATPSRPALTPLPRIPVTYLTFPDHLLTCSHFLPPALQFWPTHFRSLVVSLSVLLRVIALETSVICCPVTLNLNPDLCLYQVMKDL